MQDPVGLGEAGSGSAVQEGQWACWERTAQEAGGSPGLAGTSLGALRTEEAAYQTRLEVRLGMDRDQEGSHPEDRTDSHMDHRGRQREGIHQVENAGGKAAVVVDRDR
jgi:hypothetical protein